MGGARNLRRQPVSVDATENCFRHFFFDQNPNELSLLLSFHKCLIHAPRSKRGSGLRCQPIEKPLLFLLAGRVLCSTDSPPGEQAVVMGRGTIYLPYGPLEHHGQQHACRDRRRNSQEPDKKLGLVRVRLFATDPCGEA